MLRDALGECVPPRPGQDQLGGEDHFFFFLIYDSAVVRLLGAFDHLMVISTTDACVAVSASSRGAGAAAVVPRIAYAVGRVWVGPFDGRAWQEWLLEASACVVAMLAEGTGAGGLLSTCQCAVDRGTVRAHAIWASLGFTFLADGIVGRIVTNP